MRYGYGRSLCGQLTDTMTLKAGLQGVFCLCLCVINAIGVAGAAAQAGAALPFNSHCTGGEYTYFSCITAQGKALSLCGLAGDFSPVVATAEVATAEVATAEVAAAAIAPADVSPADILQYRFGAPGNVELMYPAAPSPASAIFRYAHYSRYQVERTAVNFRNHDFRYTIFDSYEGDPLPATRTQGVQVMHVNGVVLTTILCQSAALSRLSELRAALPCDDSDPLQLGECPATDH